MTKLTAALGLCSSAISIPVQAGDAQPAKALVLKAAHVFDSTGATLRDGATVVVTPTPRFHRTAGTPWNSD